MDLESIKSLSCDGQDMLKAEILSGDQFVTLWSETFDVSWELGGKGKMPAEYPVTYRYGVGIGQDAMPKPTRSGFKFSGWYETAAAAGNQVSSITAIDKGNKKLYPKWTTSGCCGTGYSWYEDYRTASNGRAYKYLECAAKLGLHVYNGDPPTAPNQLRVVIARTSHEVYWFFYRSR